MTKNNKDILIFRATLAAIGVIYVLIKSKAKKSSFGGDRIAFNRNVGYPMPTGDIFPEQQEFEPVNFNR